MMPKKPSLSAGVSCFILCFLFSCTTFKLPGKNNKDADLKRGLSYQEMTSSDYADHFASLKNAYLMGPGVKSIKLDVATERYLQGLLAEIISKNEIFFKDLKSARITVIDMDPPLHFSLPKGEIFVSRGLITKYIKHESMLVSVLSYELVRSEKLLYPKEVIVPTGYMPLERILMLSRLSLDEKVEIHKWAHHLTERSGYDGEYYLSWLQTQNRNTADFLLLAGDANLITREEALFKAHIIKNDSDNHVINKNSSRSFYSLINKLRDGVL